MFTGNVVVTKGTLVLRAAQVEVRQTPDGYHHGVATAAPGQLATFRQKRGDGADETIHGEAERIEYDGKADTLRLVNRAVLRRLRGGAVADETSGSVIVYNSGAETFSVTGGPSAATPGNPAGRVRATLSPRPAEGAARAAPAEGGASRPALPLKPSGSLGGGAASRDAAPAAHASGRLEAAGLQKSYGARMVVKDVHVAVQGGEVVGLLGPNGAGKTTSFYMIVGLVRADAGEISIGGRRAERLPIHERSRLGLSYLPQERRSSAS